MPRPTKANAPGVARPHAPVFYVTRIVPNYRIGVLERLNARLDGRLIVCAGEPPGSSSLASLTKQTQQAGFRRVRLRNYWLRGEMLHAQPFGRVFREYGYPAALLAEESPRSPTLPLLLRHAHRHRIGVALWGHFSSNHRPFAPDKHLEDRYRLWLARKADACVCYAESIVDLLRPYIEPRRLFVAPNTLDTDVLFRLHDELEREGRSSVRRRIGLPDQRPVFVFMGRLIRSKGTDLLLEVFRRVCETESATLLVIGDGPDRGAMEDTVRQKGLDDVHFLGPLAKWEASAPYLYASDVMLIPGYLGLAVNHAFALGVPVVSQAAPADIRFHSPEVAYVRHGENGMLADHGNLDALVEAVRHVLANHDRFSRNALTYARTHLGIDRMVDGLADAIQFVEAKQHG